MNFKKHQILQSSDKLHYRRNLLKTEIDPNQAQMFRSHKKAVSLKKINL